MTGLPEGPAWLVAIAVAAGVCIAGAKAVQRIVQALATRGETPTGEAVQRIMVRIDLLEREVRENIREVSGNVDRTRHALATPLTTILTEVQLLRRDVATLLPREQR